MELIWILILIVIIGFSIETLKNHKKMSNDSWYNVLQNSRHYRLLAIVIVSIIGLFIYLFRILVH